MKNADGGGIEVTGSIMLCHPLIEADLVDEYRLFVYPMVQGRGRRLHLRPFITLQNHVFVHGTWMCPLVRGTFCTGSLSKSTPQSCDL